MPNKIKRLPRFTMVEINDPNYYLESVKRTGYVTEHNGRRVEVVYWDSNHGIDNPLTNGSLSTEWFSPEGVRVLEPHEITWTAWQLNEEYVAISIPGKGIRVGCQWFEIKDWKAVLDACETKPQIVKPLKITKKWQRKRNSKSSTTPSKARTSKKSATTKGRKPSVSSSPGKGVTRKKSTTTKTSRAKGTKRY